METTLRLPSKDVTDIKSKARFVQRAVPLVDSELWDFIEEQGDFQPNEIHAIWNKEINRRNGTAHFLAQWGAAPDLQSSKTPITACCDAIGRLRLQLPGKTPEADIALLSTYSL